MTETAVSLVASAKQWASNYGDYANGREGAVLTAPLRIRAAWEANDADAFADMFIDNGSMLVDDQQLTSREEIRAYLAEAFTGGYRGTRLHEEPREIWLLTDTVAVAVMEGGVVKSGADRVAEGDQVRAMWVVVAQGGDWRIAARQDSPITG
jgi:uncharacterized protein (TIGR02246 family)